MTEENIEYPRWLPISDEYEKPDRQKIMEIARHGCASGVYVPAVTYAAAMASMSEFGDDILEFISGYLGDVPPPDASKSWSEWACDYACTATELWAHQTIIDNGWDE